MVTVVEDAVEQIVIGFTAQISEPAMLPVTDEPNPYALDAVSKGLQAVKLCCNKILQFISVGVGHHRFTCIMSVNQLCVLIAIFDCSPFMEAIRTVVVHFQ